MCLWKKCLGKIEFIVCFIILLQSSLLSQPMGTIKWSVNNIDYGGGPIIGNDGIIYVGNSAVDENGKIIKQTYDNGNYITIGLDNTLYIFRYGALTPNILAQNVDGTQKWLAYIDGVGSPAIGRDGTIYIHTKQGYCIAVDKDGNKKWKLSIEESDSDRFWGGAAIGPDGTVYITTANRYLHSVSLLAITQNGKIKWRIGKSLEPEKISPPVIGDDGTIYCYMGEDFTAISSSGSEKWRINTGFKEETPAIGPLGIIYAVYNDGLYALNADGSKKWVCYFGNNIFLTAPSIGADGVIYTEANGKINAINSDGTIRWVCTLPSIGYPGVSGAIVIGRSGTIYVCDNGTLYAINSSSKGLAESSWPKKYCDNANTGNAYNAHFPVAQISAPEACLLYENIEFDGSLSYDATGGGLTYAWRIIDAPSGSDNVHLSSENQVKSTCQISLPGTYRIELKVADSQNQVSFDYYTVVGGLKWKYKSSQYQGNEIYSCPAIADDGTIYINDMKDYCYAINPDGTEKWKIYTHGGPSAPAIGRDGTIYVLGYPGNLFAINPDGSLKWSFGATSFAPSENHLASPAIGADGIVYVGVDHFYAITPQGNSSWQLLNLGGGSPAIGKDGKIYIATVSGISAFAIDGTRWSYNTDPLGVSSIALDSLGTVYAGTSSVYYPWQTTRQGRVYAINSDGSLKWLFEGDGLEYYSPAIGADGTIYVGSFEKYGGEAFYAINSNGKIRWKRDGVGGGSCPTIGDDGAIYIGSSDGGLHAINPDGTEKWVFKSLEEPFVSFIRPPVVHSATIDDDGTIYFAAGYSIYAIQSTSAGLAKTEWPKFRQNKHNTGRFDISLNSFVSSENLSKEEDILFNIFPNPFNEKAIIKFYVLGSSEVNLKIFNILGKIVFERKERIKQGHNEIIWNTTGMASGTYIVQLATGIQTSHKTVTLLK